MTSFLEHHARTAFRMDYPTFWYFAFLLARMVMVPSYDPNLKDLDKLFSNAKKNAPKGPNGYYDGIPTLYGVCDGAYRHGDLDSPRKDYAR